MAVYKDGEPIGGKHLYPTNHFYVVVSVAEKIVMSILEQGLEHGGSGTIRYNAKTGKSWLSKLARDLEGEVSRATIDQYLDSLLDKRILVNHDQVMERVSDAGGQKWVRTYYVGNEYLRDVMLIYNGTHNIPGTTKPETINTLMKEPKS